MKSVDIKCNRLIRELTRDLKFADWKKKLTCTADVRVNLCRSNCNINWFYLLLCILGLGFELTQHIY